MVDSRPLYLLLFSGGVDSTLCLWKLVKKGITPIIFHFWTEKLQKKHEQMIRKVAKLISPKSPYYVFKTETNGYHAISSPNFVPDEYSIKSVYLKGRGRVVDLYPLKYADYVVLGYTKWLYGNHKTSPKIKGRRQRKFIEFCKQLELPYVFPLADYTREQANEEFSKLPKEIRENVVSSTRHWKESWEHYVKDE